MGRMAAEAGVLDAMLDALCGWERPADSDRVVREALAEALLMLVGARVLAGLRRSCLQSVAVGVYGNVRQCRGTTELSGTPALQLGLIFVLTSVPHGCSAHLTWTSPCLWPARARTRARLPVPARRGRAALAGRLRADLGRCVGAQAEDEEGRTALWGVKAPEKLRKGCGPPLS
jgi:hypothetical protein